MEREKGGRVVTSKLNVVVWGAGTLGLGLLGSRAMRADLPLVLVLQDTPSARHVKRNLATRKSYVVGPEVAAGSRVEVDRVFWFAEDGRDLDDLIGYLATTENVLFCTAARSGQVAAIRIIRDAMERRVRLGTGGIFVVAACENSISLKMATIRSRVPETRFVYLNSVVDRICTERKIAGKGTVWVRTELDPGEWIGQPELSRAGNIRAFRAVVPQLVSMGIDLVNDVEPFRTRKRYIVNGVQTSAAMLGMHDKTDTSPTADAPLANVLESWPNCIKELCSEYLAALSETEDWDAISGDIEGYVDWAQRRIDYSVHELEETVGRVIKVYGDVEEAAAIEDFHKKIAEPYSNLRKACASQGLDPKQSTMYAARCNALGKFKP